MRPRHDDGFVLIGLCWLYGRSEFPPPPPPPPLLLRNAVQAGLGLCRLVSHPHLLEICLQAMKLVMERAISSASSQRSIRECQTMTLMQAVRSVRESSHDAEYAEDKV